MNYEIFVDDQEEKNCKTFLEEGFLICNVVDNAGLMRIQDFTVRMASNYLKISIEQNNIDFLNSIHQHVSPSKLNDMRLYIIESLNSQDWFRPAYYNSAKQILDCIVGNELCMQRRVNLSIQMPQDDGSLLAIHSDVWSGDSPFEVVVWIPLVDVYSTKSMYILPPDKNKEFEANMSKYSSSETLFQSVKSHVVWPTIKFGDLMIFNQTLMHGNRVNVETTTRWSLNCRFKSVMSPYSDKKIGEFFEPISIKPATKIGINYKLPGGFCFGK